MPRNSNERERETVHVTRLSFFGLREGPQHRWMGPIAAPHSAASPPFSFFLFGPPRRWLPLPPPWWWGAARGWIRRFRVIRFVRCSFPSPSPRVFICQAKPTSTTTTTTEDQGRRTTGMEVGGLCPLALPPSPPPPPPSRVKRCLHCRRAERPLTARNETAIRGPHSHHS